MLVFVSDLWKKYLLLVADFFPTLYLGLWFVLTGVTTAAVALLYPVQDNGLLAILIPTVLILLFVLLGLFTYVQIDKHLIRNIDFIDEYGDISFYSRNTCHLFKIRGGKVIEGEQFLRDDTEVLHVFIPHIYSSQSGGEFEILVPLKYKNERLEIIGRVSLLVSLSREFDLKEVHDVVIKAGFVSIENWLIDLYQKSAKNTFEVDMAFAEAKEEADLIRRLSGVLPLIKFTDWKKLTNITEIEAVLSTEKVSFKTRVTY